MTIEEYLVELATILGDIGFFLRHAETGARLEGVRQSYFSAREGRIKKAQKMISEVVECDRPMAVESLAFTMKVARFCLDRAIQRMNDS